MEVEEGEVYTAFAIGQASEGTIGNMLTVDSDNGRLVGPRTLQDTSGDLSLLEANPEPQPERATSTIAPKEEPKEKAPKEESKDESKKKPDNDGKEPSPEAPKEESKEEPDNGGKEPSPEASKEEAAPSQSKLPAPQQNVEPEVAANGASGGESVESAPPPLRQLINSFRPACSWSGGKMEPT